MKHTPGPWGLDGGSNKEGDLFVWECREYMGKDYAVAKVVGRHPDTEANARLIAAAPDMYAALSVALGIIDEMDGNSSALDSMAYEVNTARNAIRAALGKAEGR